MDQEQQYQPQDYQLRNRPEPGQRPNRTAVEKNIPLAANNPTEAQGRQADREEQTTPKKEGNIKNMLKFFLPLGGTGAAMWGAFKFLS